MTPTPEARRVAAELASRIIDIMSGTGVGKTWAMVVKNKRMLATDAAYQALTRAAQEAREEERKRAVAYLRVLQANHPHLHGPYEHAALNLEAALSTDWQPDAAALRQAGQQKP